MTEGHFITEPVFDSFTVRLKAGFDEPPEDLAALVLAEFLGDSEGWSSRPIHPSLPLMFDLVPPREGAISVKEAWDLTHTLRHHPNVLEAEPAFETILDNVPEPDELDDLSGTFLTRLFRRLRR